MHKEHQLILLDNTLNLLIQLLWSCGKMLFPFLPNSTLHLFNICSFPETINLDDLAEGLSGITIQQTDYILFKRILT
jgi:hypothetical protein